MASAGAAGTCGPGATPGPIRGGSVPPSGASNPRKFSEKIALHTQRQAEETAAFQELMMDLTSTRVQAQKVRLTRGLYYGGSLPNVNQIGRNLSELQSHLDSSRSTRHHGLVERVHRDRRFISPSRPYRRQMDSVYLSPPPDPSWRRNWNNNFPPDKSQIFHQLPTTALNRTNSDSALHTSVMNPPAGDSAGGGQALTLRGRCGMYTYHVPPIEENGPEDGALLKPWDSRKLPLLSSRPKSCEVPGITVFPSPDQQGGVPQASAVLNTGGSLPDLSSLHFPSPLPTPLDPDEPGYPTLSGGSSTGNLASTLTQLGINTHNAFHSPGLLPSLQGTLGNPSLQSSLSNPNIQLSLSSHSLPSSASLHSSLSNPSLQSSLSSSPSLRSSLSNQSLHSSLSNSSLSGQSLQSAVSNQPAYSSAAGGPGSFPLHIPGQSTSPRRRVPLSPVILTSDARRHHSKQFSPTAASPLTSITQGVALDTRQLQVDQRLSQCSFGQLGTIPGQTGSQPHMLQPSPQSAQLHLHNMQNLHKMQKFHMPPFKQPNQNQKPTSYRPADGTQPNNQEQEPLAQTGVPAKQYGAQNRFDQQNFQQISQTLSAELDLYNDSAFLNSLLDDPWTTLQLTGRQNQNLSQQFSLDSLEGLSDSGSAVKRQQGALQLLESPELNQGRCQSYTDGAHAGANLILTDSPSGLSKEITNALSAVPGFEIDPFSSDDTLRMDPLALEGLGMLAHGDLMLDPDSFRSDHLK